jgi:tRNA pseudouridine38-40 synthase
MERYQLILAYDGTHFAGFQRQAKARTVQNEVEKALRQLGWEENSILAAGRTDSGVHAAGQVVSFQMNWNHSLEKLLTALNTHLPPDVAGREIHRVPADFHPRFSALNRRYSYHLVCQPIRDPLAEQYAWRIWPEVLLKPLQTCAELFLGTHDFVGFGTPPRVKSSTIRTIYVSEWKSDGDQLIYYIIGNSFLYHMVRRMVYIQVMVGQQRLETPAVQQSLELGCEINLRGIAPAQGLVLEEVIYPI